MRRFAENLVCHFENSSEKVYKTYVLLSQEALHVSVIKCNLPDRDIAFKRMDVMWKCADKLNFATVSFYFLAFFFVSFRIVSFSCSAAASRNKIKQKKMRIASTSISMICINVNYTYFCSDFLGFFFFDTKKKIFISTHKKFPWIAVNGWLIAGWWQQMVMMKPL